MGEHLRLYRTIMSFVSQSIAMNDFRNLSTLVWMVVGLLLSKRIHLSQWALYRAGDTQAASRERQNRRWLSNAKIEVKAVYRNLMTAALNEWRESDVWLALDSSVLWDRFVLVRIALVYRGRSLPLVWKVLEQGSASVSFANYSDLLPEAARLLPQSSRVVLLADRGFVDVDLMTLATQLGWGFTIRCKGSLWVYRAFHPRCKVNRLMPPSGEIRLLHTVQLSQRRFGPVHLVLAHVRTPNGYEQWSLVSDRPTSLATLDEYALRFDIEESFLDDKSAGFQLQASQLRNAQALARLCLVLAVATLYLVSLGTTVVACNLRPLVDSHWQRGLSYLQLGWRYLARALLTGDKLLTSFWLDPEPDPEPVFASKRQAALPTLAFSSIAFFD